MDNHSTSRVLITGATGYLGCLIAARILAQDPTTSLVLPVRKRWTTSDVHANLVGEARVYGRPEADLLRDAAARVEVVPLEGASIRGSAALERAIGAAGLDEVIHCAGCIDYFDESSLEAVNVEMTRQIVDAAPGWGARRLTYVSTAFSGGYREGVTPEALLEEPARDPTIYTRTKRRAEHIVAGGPLPHLIVRPSVVIGDSQTGRYAGKRYGLYQLWSGVERLLTDHWRSTLHIPASLLPAHLLHQDAFLDGFFAARRLLPDGSIVNLTGDPASAPSVRELWTSILTRCLQPEEIVYWDDLYEIPLTRLDVRQRALLALASVNLEIAAHPWSFERTNAERLARLGAPVASATLASVDRCQEAFIAGSEPLQRFIRQSLPREAAGTADRLSA